jgi:hypothetical protein
MDCRYACVARCIAPSICTPSPGAAAGVSCAQVTAELHYRLFGAPRRTAVYMGLAPSIEMCRHDAAGAKAWLTALEEAIRPAGPAPSALRRVATPTNESA